jgi:hypothetical protein
MAGTPRCLVSNDGSSMTRIQHMIAAALVFVSAAAAANDTLYDAKALARYDVSYGHCEASFPEMKGHRDDAYLNLWRVKMSPKSAARLETLRKSAPYKSERERAATLAARTTAPEAVKKLERQCRGLWGELARTPKAPSGT